MLVKIEVLVEVTPAEGDDLDDALREVRNRMDDIYVGGQRMQVVEFAGSVVAPA